LSPYGAQTTSCLRLATCIQSYPENGEGSFLLNGANRLEIIQCYSAEGGSLIAMFSVVWEI